MPSPDDRTPTPAPRQPASTALDLDEFAAQLLEAWPRVGADHDVVMAAALFAETITQLLRGDLEQAAAIAGRVHDVAEQAAETAWPSWTCPTCGDRLNAAQANEHTRRMHGDAPR